MLENIQLQLVLATFAGRVGRQQSAVISYLVEENRRLIAAKWTYPHKRVGHPGVMKEIRGLIVRMAEENPSWGYARIRKALKHLDHRVARSTIAKTLKGYGIKPSPDRPMSWRTFVRSHAHLIAAADFFATEVWTASGLARHYTLFVIDVATRGVHIAGTTTNPTSTWMEQTARNLTDCEEGFRKRFLVIDRDAKFLRKFKSILGDSGIEIMLTAHQAPNINAHVERFVKSIKSQCLDKMIFLGRASLVRAIAEYAAHYHEERSHQKIGNVLISRAGSRSSGIAEARERLGGLLKYYHGMAA